MAVRLRWNYAPSAVSLLIIALLAANYIRPLADLDFTWQIHTGEEILRTGELHTPDRFTFTIAGKRVPDFEWLYEVTLALVWNAFGYGGLKLLRTLCVFVPLLLVGLRLRRAGVAWRGIALALFVAVMVLAPSWNLRPLYCTTIGLLLVSGALHDHCTGRRPLSLWLPVVMLLWANLHPGVIVGQALLVGAITWEWLNRRLHLNAPLDAAACRRLTWLGGLGLAATFVSPDPIERLLYPLPAGVAPSGHARFHGNAPAVLLPHDPALYGRPRLPCRRTHGLDAAPAFSPISALGSGPSRRPWHPGQRRLPGRARLAARDARSCRPASGANAARGGTGAAAAPGSLLEARPSRTGVPVPVVLADSGGFAALAVVSVTPPLSRAVPVQDHPDWPVAAVDWIEAHGVEGRIFAGPNDGAYLTWRLPGRVRCYADTRGFFFPPEILEDCQYLPQLTPDWPARLQRVRSYGADYFLLRTTGPHGGLWRAIQAHISEPLYRDGAVVLLRTDQVADGLAAYEQEQAALRPLPALGAANP